MLKYEQSLSLYHLQAAFWQRGTFVRVFQRHFSGLINAHTVLQELPCLTEAYLMQVTLGRCSQSCSICLVWPR